MVITCVHVFVVESSDRPVARVDPTRRAGDAHVNMAYYSKPELRNKEEMMQKMTIDAKTQRNLLKKRSKQVK